MTPNTPNCPKCGTQMASLVAYPGWLYCPNAECDQAAIPPQPDPAPQPSAPPTLKAALELAIVLCDEVDDESPEAVSRYKRDLPIAKQALAEAAQLEAAAEVPTQVAPEPHVYFPQASAAFGVGDDMENFHCKPDSEQGVKIPHAGQLCPKCKSRHTYWRGALSEKLTCECGYILWQDPAPPSPPPPSATPTLETDAAKKYYFGDNRAGMEVELRKLTYCLQAQLSAVTAERDETRKQLTRERDRREQQEQTSRQLNEDLAKVTADVQHERDRVNGWIASFGHKDAELQAACRTIDALRAKVAELESCCCYCGGKILYAIERGGHIDGRVFHAKCLDGLDALRATDAARAGGASEA